MMVSRGVEKRGTHEPWSQQELAATMSRILNF